MFRLLLLPLLLPAGCWVGFASPGVHITNATQIPVEATGMTERFRLPDELDDVFYFTPGSPRCNYYLRGSLGKESLQRYETTVLNSAQELARMPRDISGPDVARIQHWWLSPDSEGLRMYALHDLDYVILDHDQGILYVAMCED